MEIVERLRAKDADWRAQCDVWEAGALERAKGKREAAKVRKAFAKIRQTVYGDAADELERLFSALSEASAEAGGYREALERGTALVTAFLRYFDPSDLPEDQSQQWQQLEHWLRRALSATGPGD